MKLTLLYASARLFVAATLIAFAGISNADSTYQKELMYKLLDADGDGLITALEAAENEKVAKKFAELDSDESGTLSEGEFARFEAVITPEMVITPKMEGEPEVEPKDESIDEKLVPFNMPE